MPPTTRSKARHNASGRLPEERPQKKAKGGITMPRSDKSKEPELPILSFSDEELEYWATQNLLFLTYKPNELQMYNYDVRFYKNEEWRAKFGNTPVGGARASATLHKLIQTSELFAQGVVLAGLEESCMHWSPLWQLANTPVEDSEAGPSAAGGAAGGPHLQVAVDDIRGFAKPHEATLPDPADRFTKGDKVQNRGLHAEVYASQGPQDMVPGKVLTQSSLNTHMERQVYSVEAITKTWVQKLPSCASCQSRGTAPIRGCSNCRGEYEDLIRPEGNEY